MSDHAQPIQDEDARQFFEGFVEAFASFDGTIVAKRYQTPFIAIDSEGVSRVLMTREEIGQYFQGFLDAYRADGCTYCEYRNLIWTAIGTLSALLTVDWELFRASGTIVQSWRESYIVVRKDSGLYVSSSIDHAL